jgi:hypothetical protein
MDKAQRIRANFSAMPNLLKLVTAAAVGPVLFILIAIVSSGGAPILPLRGRTPGLEFWTSSAGVAALLASSLFCAASVLMLKRSPVGRVTYIVAHMGMCAALPALGEIVGIRATARTGQCGQISVDIDSCTGLSRSTERCAYERNRLKDVRPYQCTPCSYGATPIMATLA